MTRPAEQDTPFAAQGGYAAFIARDPAGPVPRRSQVYDAVKRLVDIGGALLGLLLILPLFPFLALLIKLDSPGPLLFKQKRVGEGGRLFDCYKFRSMVVDAEAQKDRLRHLNEASGAAFKIAHDPRITGVGRFIRRSSLDEFPQLLNVLKGDMSIVGPRPQIPSEVSQYTPRQARRLLVKPGLTCLWQVSGRSSLDFEEWMALDLEYVARRGLGFDIWVLTRTIPAVIERKGAY
ncbi:MAG TPA: sugar transferase [Candidatus Krumholzibacteria bacterium]|nr:sugar transferase [Candidatus Krumholzibacteria bacterium]HRX50437.1 sugar transferase [Candidatus Krumholzibacteria bacterium]